MPPYRGGDDGHQQQGQHHQQQMSFNMHMPPYPPLAATATPVAHHPNIHATHDPYANPSPGFAAHLQHHHHHGVGDHHHHHPGAVTSSPTHTNGNNPHAAGGGGGGSSPHRGGGEGGGGPPPAPVPSAAYPHGPPPVPHYAPYPYPTMPPYPHYFYSPPHGGGGGGGGGGHPHPHHHHQFPPPHGHHPHHPHSPAGSHHSHNSPGNSPARDSITGGTVGGGGGGGMTASGENPREFRRGPTASEIEQARTARARSALTTWYQRLEDLYLYKRRYGDCNVPQKFDQRPELGIWVNKQRMEKKAYDEGKKSSMTEHKIAALNELGFQWAKRKGEAAWNEKYAELVKYKEEHGDCQVPTKYPQNPALGRWVSTQRSNYKEYEKGDRSKLTQEKKELLEALGFKWKMMNPIIF